MLSPGKCFLELNKKKIVTRRSICTMRAKYTLTSIIIRFIMSNCEIDIVLWEWYTRENLWSRAVKLISQLSSLDIETAVHSFWFGPRYLCVRLAGCPVDLECAYHYVSRIILRGSLKTNWIGIVKFFPPESPGEAETDIPRTSASANICEISVAADVLRFARLIDSEIDTYRYLQLTLLQLLQHIPIPYPFLLFIIIF